VKIYESGNYKVYRRPKEELNMSLVPPPIEDDIRKWLAIDPLYLPVLLFIFFIMGYLMGLSFRGIKCF
jgi:hypothetical protein